MAKRDIESLPRVVGVLADAHYTKQEWIQTLILSVRPNTVIATTSGGSMEAILERLSVLRGDVYFKKFEQDDWEERIKGKKHATKLKDYLFLSYLKFNKGFLFLFPARYNTRTIGMQYSTRMQDMIILAHQMKIPYDIISVDGEDDNT